jgi:hypothetical protein
MLRIVSTEERNEPSQGTTALTSNGEAIPRLSKAKPVRLNASPAPTALDGK